jgi:hypothetical protein
VSGTDRCLHEQSRVKRFRWILAEVTGASVTAGSDSDIDHHYLDATVPTFGPRFGDSPYDDHTAKRHVRPENARTGSELSSVARVHQTRSPFVGYGRQTGVSARTVNSDAIT